MTAITIDTYALITSLKDAGVPEQQAKAQVEVITRISEVTRRQIEHDHKLDDIATKRDIKDLELKIEQARADLLRDLKELDLRIETKIEKSNNKLIMWMVSLGTAQVGAVFFILKLLEKV